MLGYTATPEVCWNSNLLCLSMSLSSSCSKFLSVLQFEVAGLVRSACLSAMLRSMVAWGIIEFKLCKG